jgi:uncharacterized protein YqgV (UPF0045/DUF77 family)
VQRVEFTIEPFNEGVPGRHVTAPADMLRSMDVEVEVGPFGSSCVVDDDRAGDVVAAVVRSAIEHGASHVNVDVEAAT